MTVCGRERERESVSVHHRCPANTKRIKQEVQSFFEILQLSVLFHVDRVIIVLIK